MAQIGSQYDDPLNTAALAVAPIEEAYFAANGRYQQLKRLSDAGLTEPANIAVTVDFYDGPSGRGYVVNGYVLLNGVSYRRSINVGPETYRTTDGWIEISQEVR